MMNGRNCISLIALAILIGGLRPFSHVRRRLSLFSFMRVLMSHVRVLMLLWVGTAFAISVNRKYSRGSAGASSLLPARLSGVVGCLMPRAAGWAVAALLIMSLIPVTVNAAAPGTVIDNQAFATYSVPGVGLANTLSNTASVTTVSGSTTASVTIMQYAPTDPLAALLDVSTSDYLNGGASYVPMPAAPVPAGSSTPIDLSTPVPLVSVGVFHMGEPLFVSIDDADQNTDPLGVDTIVITIAVSPTGESETIRLYETGPDTGVFTGYIQTVDAAPSPADGQLSLEPGATVTVNYTDPVDSTVSTLAVIADPAGLVFDSRTGAVLDGVTISIFDSLGNPALVNGDDATSAFPSSIVTGSTVTDSNGKTYVFGPGEFRFPYLPSGDYQIVVTPPTGYVFPSVVSDALINALVTGPYDLLPASRGTVFSVTDEHAISVDMPLDSLSGTLIVTKSANSDNAAIGDFILYAVTIEEATANTVYNARLVDTLPQGFVYREGSAMINGVTVVDPTISPDRRILTFALGDLAPGSAMGVKYVIEVAAGARLGDAVNRAYAEADSGVTSNIASHTVRVREDLFRSKAIIMGRVVADGCGKDSALSGKGINGVRVYMEDGSYVVTDDNGMFNFKGVKPGSHVVQLDYDSLPAQYEPVLCEDTTEQAGSAFSRFVDVHGGTLWRTDFHLGLKPRTKGDVKVEIDSSIVDDGLISYRISMGVGKVPLDNTRVTVIMPEGTSYVRESSTLGGSRIEDPSDIAGSLTFRPGRIGKDSDTVLAFMASAKIAGDEGSFLTKVIVTFDTPAEKNLRTPVLENTLIRDVDESEYMSSFVLSAQFAPLSANLSADDKAKLDKLIEGLRGLNIDHIFVFGHTDSLPLSIRAKQKYRDNYDLSRDRARSVANYVGKALDLKKVDISYVGHGHDKPVADNATEQGRKKNRRVEIKVFEKKIDRSYTLRTANGDKAKADVEIVGGRGDLLYAKGDEADAAGKEDSVPEYDSQWLNGVDEALGWVWPAEGYYPSIPSMSVAIKSSAGTEIRIERNGSPVSNIYLEYTMVNNERTKTLRVYKGVPLTEGDNDFVISEYRDGVEIARTQRVVHYSSWPVEAELLPAKSSLIADGRTSPILAVRLTDRDGHPARTGVMGEFNVASPYTPQRRDEGTMDTMPEGVTKYTVGRDGVAYIKLAPTAVTGEVALSLHLGDGERKVRAWLSPAMRDWILVGLAEGTAGYAMLDGNKEALERAGYDDGIYSDGRVAFFAKGRVKGKWLLTMAYDSAKPGYDERQMHSIIDPDEYYTLYGDFTEQGNEAASSRKLFVKIESEKFYALFGDYNTDLTVTRLSRYSRSMNGLKAEYMGDTLRYKVFASDTSHAFVKDEIPGDGTSGLYRLTRKNIVMNSDKVIIETRDRFRPDVVLDTHTLVRHIDYDIDYLEGTLFFRQPVNVTDDSFNPNYIVVDYESYDQSDMSFNYGGRGAVSMADDRAEVGISYIHEESVGREGELAGFDTTLKVGEHTEVKAEVAASEVQSVAGTEEGSAYSVEVKHRTRHFRGVLYALEQDENFGLGQQSGSQSGLRRFGFDADYDISRALNVKGSIYRQYNIITDAEREFAEAGIKYDVGNVAYWTGLRKVVDTFSDGTELVSDQVTAGVLWRTLNNRLRLSLERQQSISDNNANADYPTMTTLGAEYLLKGNAALFAAHEVAEGDEIEYEATRAGIRANPWEGGSVNSSLERQFNENGTRVFSNFGLMQNWKFNDRWALSGSYDRRDTILDNTRSAIDNGTLFDTEDFMAVSAGSTYSRDKFAWRNRVEYRTSESYDKVGLFSGVNGEPRRGVGLSAALRAFRTLWTTGAERVDVNLRFGAVRRPFEAKWIVLDRLDFYYEEDTGGALEYDSWRVVNNLNGNYKLMEKYQVSLQYGSKYVKDTIEGLDYKGYTDLMGLEARYNINSRWDVGPRFSVLHSYDPGRVEYMSGVSVGYSFRKNIWVSLGYNFDGFHDRDFSRANYTAQGVFIKFRIKFDQVSAKEAVKRFSGM